MKKLQLIPFLVILMLMSSCYATMHTVGEGGPGDCKTQYDAKKKQWYWLYGAVPITKVDSKQLAGGAKNYTVRVTSSFGDLLIRAAGGYLLGFGTQTVRVSKGKE